MQNNVKSCKTKQNVENNTKIIPNRVYTPARAPKGTPRASKKTARAPKSGPRTAKGTQGRPKKLSSAPALNGALDRGALDRFLGCRVVLGRSLTPPTKSTLYKINGLNEERTP